MKTYDFSVLPCPHTVPAEPGPLPSSLAAPPPGASRALSLPGPVQEGDPAPSSVRSLLPWRVECVWVWREEMSSDVTTRFCISALFAFF